MVVVFYSKRYSEDLATSKYECSEMDFFQM